MKIILFQICLLLLVGCDNILQPEVIAINDKEVYQNEDEFVCIYPIEDLPRLLTPLDSLQLKFDKITDQNHFQGQMIVQFTVNKIGKVEEPKVIRGGNEKINEQARKFIKSVRFEPGTVRGEPASFSYSLPLKLK